MTEADILAALEGHFYRMHYTKNGIEVIDVAQGKPPVDYDDALDPPPPPKRPYFAPNSIDWRGRDDRVMEMRQAGASFKAIGKTIGVSDASVRARYVKLCRMRGFDVDTSCLPPLRMFSPEVEAQLVKARDSGLTFRAVAKQFGISEAGAWTIYRRWYRQKDEAA